MKWRFIQDDPRDAAMNMAVDESLFLSALSGTNLPTVRLYTWSRPSVSIGFRQNMAEACDLEACRRLGVDTVRRMSGGRAVLHHHELTYCVAAAANEKFRGLSVREIYSWVTGTLREAFASLNVLVDAPAIPPSPSLERAETDPGLPCFAVPTGHEITAQGMKLVGSAQKRTRQGFLQHGSIILELDREFWKETTGLADSSDLGAVGLRELAKRSVPTAELASIIKNRFENRFGESPSMDALSERETQVARILAREKYSSDTWNLHRKTPEIQEVIGRS